MLRMFATQICVRLRLTNHDVSGSQKAISPHPNQIGFKNSQICLVSVDPFRSGLLQPIPWKMRFEMVIGMQIEILKKIMKLLCWVSFRLKI